VVISGELTGNSLEKGTIYSFIVSTPRVVIFCIFKPA